MVDNGLNSIVSRGRCLGVDPDVFFPEGENDKAEQDSPAIKEAKAICDLCRVQVECLEWAIASREKEGIRGGRTSFERRQIVRQRGRGTRTSKRA